MQGENPWSNFMILFGCSNSPSKQHPLRNATLQIIVRFFDWNGSEVYSVYIYIIYITYILENKDSFIHSVRIGINIIPFINLKLVVR